MQKLLAGTLVVACLCAPAVAQGQMATRSSTSRGSMMIGPVVGLNFATFGGSTATSSTPTASSKTGFAFGGQLQRTLSPNLFLRIGAQYSMRGSNASDGSGSIKANYIEFPVVLGYQFAMSGSQTKPYIFGGGQLGIKASCNVTSSGTTTDCNTTYGITVPSTDFGVTGGAGVGFAAGKGMFSVDARYYIGFTNLLKTAGPGNELKNKGFSVAAAYMVAFGR